MIYLTFLFLLLLLFIAIYDFKYLAVPLILLILTILLALFRIFYAESTVRILKYSLINLTGLTLFLALSFLILFLLRRKIINPFNSYIGMGDLLFFPVICISFSPFNFIFFIICSFSILLLTKPVLFRTKNTIPLAGGISFMYSILLVIDFFITIDFYDDSGLIKLLFQ